MSGGFTFLVSQIPAKLMKMQSFSMWRVPCRLFESSALHQAQKAMGEEV